MGLVRMSIQTVVVSNGFTSSMVVLRPIVPVDPEHPVRLPIRIGFVEASSIGMGVATPKHDRPMTHDLLGNAISALGARVTSVVIDRVEGSTFYAKINLTTDGGDMLFLDARPSDALALAVRTDAPIFTTNEVLDTASCPDFHEMDEQSKREELERFSDFVSKLNPEDFSSGSPTD